MRKLACVLLPIFCVFVLTGCPKDDRMKQQASLLNVKTQVAKRELKAAKTADDKVKVAEEYFRNADKMTEVIEAYMFSRKPPVSQVPVGDE